MTLILFPPFALASLRSLDPENDPLCVLLLIDFLSLRARKYSFLTCFFEEWEVSSLVRVRAELVAELAPHAAEHDLFLARVAL